MCCFGFYTDHPPSLSFRVINQIQLGVIPQRILFIFLTCLSTHHLTCPEAHYAALDRLQVPSHPITVSGHIPFSSPEYSGLITNSATFGPSTGKVFKAAQTKGAGWSMLFQDSAGARSHIGHGSIRQGGEQPGLPRT
jgi:hypothetical protein